MRKTFFAIIIVFILIFLSANANAFDGKRKGFILGGGIGPGFTTFKEEIEFFWLKIESERLNKAAIMTDFKIGYAPSDFWEIYYTNKVSWFWITGDSEDKVTIANGLAALGATYYFKPEAPSPFIAGGVGVTAWSAIFESDPGTEYGAGLFAGAGYEFARHFSMELDFLLLTGPVTNAFSVKLTVNALAY